MKVRYLVREITLGSKAWKEVDKDVWDAMQEGTYHEDRRYDVEIVSDAEDTLKKRQGRPFQPEFDMPMNVTESLAVLKKWGEGTCFTFSHERAKRIWEVLSYAQGTWIDNVCEKDGDIAAIVNALRDTIKGYHNAEQLRERIADIVVPHLKELADLRHRMEGT